MNVNYNNRISLSKTLIYIYFIGVSLTYIIITPPFETPDENLHLQYINYVSKNGELPNQYTGYKEKIDYVGQGHQHPLYYILMGTICKLFLADGTIDINLAYNKEHVWGGGLKSAVSVFSHTVNGFNSSSDKNMFYIIRVISVLFSLINLFFVYKISEFVLKDKNLAIFSMFLVASLPQFQFISSAITNDNIAGALSSASIYYLLLLLNDHGKIRNFLLLSLFFGLGLLAKKTLMFLFLSYGVVIVYSLIQDRNQSKLITNIFVSLVTIFVISGWFFIRNYMLYGEFLGSQMEIKTMPNFVDKKSLFSIYFLIFSAKSSIILFNSFIGRFGWMNVHIPVYIPLFYFISIVLSYFEIMIRLISKKITYKNVIIFSFLTILFCLGGIVYFNLTYTQQQGRYIFPVISLIVLLMTIGLDKLNKRLSKERNKSLFYSFISAIIIFNIISLYTEYIFYD